MRNSSLKWCLAALVALLASAFGASTSHAAKAVDWESLNEMFKGAAYVNNPQSCLKCHDDVMETFSHTAHAKALRDGKAEGISCETCHGPRSLHVKDEKSYALPTQNKAAVCLQCHEGGDKKHWASSAHNSQNVTCTNCHTIMKKKSPRFQLAAEREDQVCNTCHTDTRAELNKASHHPVREGKMKCSDCHNAHGSPTEKMLKGNSVNETCLQCHQEKRGPFLWEHAPARENCMTCHNAHGSNNRKLQNGKDAFVCMQCHTYGGHINLPRYNRTSNPTREGCVNCHMTIHGSNSPSGRKFTR